MDFLFAKHEAKKKPRSFVGEYLAAHQHEFVIIALLFGTYATIKVLLLQHEMDRRMHHVDDRSYSREKHPKSDIHSEDGKWRKMTRESDDD